MSINRRDFLRAAVSAPALALAGAGEAEAMRAPKPVPPDAVGMLYDSTLCIGCKACVAACREANDLSPVMEPGQEGWNEKTWDSPLDLSAKTFNIIKTYQHGTMAAKDREQNGFAFMKRHCLHCADPSCVSACPVSAMRKDPKTGIVSYDANACIGCRYCVYSCPFGIPRFDYSSPTGKIGKCEFCRHLQADGKTPACCHVCPTGASLFGLVVDLKAEAQRRLALKAGDAYDFPRGNLSGGRSFGKGKGLGDGQRQDHREGGPDAGDAPKQRRLRERAHLDESALDGGHKPHQSPHPGRIAPYQPHLYGDKELGGTQVMYLSGVPFEKLELPTKVPEQGYAALSEGIQHTLYKGMIAPILFLGGLAALAFRNTRKHGDEEGER
ncbi:MAG: hydrogenase 2 operon protein HybA [Magnetospirillum sp. WYHS-4]